MFDKSDHFIVLSKSQNTHYRAEYWVYSVWYEVYYETEFRILILGILILCALHFALHVYGGIHIILIRHISGQYVWRIFYTYLDISMYTIQFIRFGKEIADSV